MAHIHLLIMNIFFPSTNQNQLKHGLKPSNVIELIFSFYLIECIFLCVLHSTLANLTSLLDVIRAIFRLVFFFFFSILSNKMHTLHFIYENKLFAIILLRFPTQKKFFLLVISLSMF